MLWKEGNKDESSWGKEGRIDQEKNRGSQMEGGNKDIGKRAMSLTG